MQTNCDLKVLYINSFLQKKNAENDSNTFFKEILHMDKTHREYQEKQIHCRRMWGNHNPAAKRISFTISTNFSDSL